MAQPLSGLPCLTDALDKDNKTNPITGSCDGHLALQLNQLTVVRKSVQGPGGVGLVSVLIAVVHASKIASFVCENGPFESSSVL
ncbi:hypothetical protein Ciccas_014202 [Cichlidogyrus casuarinus]|uniref:Uncharacterized protein n=1 Tax=Cichlidogyrus casuarinus TaxID=1844966 RepID=A0ABD2PJT0_9PLAT